MALRRFRLQSASEQPRCGTLGLSSTAKQAALELIETMIGGEKAITVLVPNDNACCFRANFDDVCI